MLKELRGRQVCRPLLFPDEDPDGDGIRMPADRKDPFYKLAAAAIYDRNLVNFYQMPNHLRQTLVILDSPPPEPPARNQQMLSANTIKKQKNNYYFVKKLDEILRE